MVNRPSSKDWMMARIDFLEAENERLKEQVIKLLAYANAIIRKKGENKYEQKEERDTIYDRPSPNPKGQRHGIRLGQ